MRRRMRGRAICWVVAGLMARQVVPVHLLASQERGATRDTLRRPSADSTRDDAQRVGRQALSQSPHYNLIEPNYFLFGFENLCQNATLSPGAYARQVKFRVALRYRVLSLGESGHDSGLHLGFRQESFWHFWEPSKPFFDNNYNPSLFAYLDGRDYSSRPLAPSVALTIEHESNGRDGSQSRSWNRVGVGIDVGDHAKHPAFVQVRGWRPFTVATENADLADYAGRGEVTLNVQPFVRSPAATPSTGGMGTLGARARWRVLGRDAVVGQEYNVYVGTGVLDLLQWNRTHRLLQLVRRAAGWVNASVVVQYYHGYAENLLTYRERRSAFRLGLATVR